MTSGTNVLHPTAGTACPSCGAETQPAMTRCRACGAALAGRNGRGKGGAKPQAEPGAAEERRAPTPADRGVALFGLAEILEMADDASGAKGTPVETPAHLGNGDAAKPQAGAATGGERARAPAAGTGPEAETNRIESDSGAGVPLEPSPDVIWLDCQCGRRLRVKKTSAGKRIRCPKCEKALQVPGATDATPRTENAAASRTFRTIAEALESQPAAAKGEPKKGAKRTLSAMKLRSRTRALAKKGNKYVQDVDARVEAVKALGESRDPRALDAIVPALADEVFKVREAAATALGDCGDPRAAARLIGLLDDETAELHRATLASLAKVADRRTVRPLLQFGVEAPHTRFQASETIVKMGEPAVPALVELVNDGEAGMALEAIVLLGRIGDKRACKSLVQVLETRSPIFRSHAAEALGSLRDGRAVTPLLAFLDDADPNVRLNVAAALAKLPDPQSVGPLIERLADEDDAVRAKAVTALGEIGDKRAAEPLCALLGSSNQELKVAAAEALGQIGDARAVEPLLGLVKGEDEAIQLKAIGALRRLKDRRAVASLLELLDNPSELIRQRVIDTLGQTGDAETAQRLEGVLRTDRSEVVRVAVAKALGEIKDPASIDALQDALHDDFAVRCRAIISLGAIGDEAALPALLAMLKDAQPEVRYHAAVALADIGSENARKALEPLLDDTNQMVRRGAAKALQKLGDPRGEERLAESGFKKLRRSAVRLAGSVTPGILLGLLWPESPRGRMVVVGLLAVGVLGGFFAFSGLGSGGTGGAIVNRGNVLSVSFAPDGGTLAVGRSRGLVELWDSGSGSINDTVVTDLDEVRGIVASGAETLFMIGGREVRVWKDDTLQSLSGGHTSKIRRIDVAPGGKWASTCSDDGVAVVWSLQTAKPHGALQLPSKGVQAIAVSADGASIATAVKQTVSIWNVESAQAEQEFQVPAAVSSLAFSATGGELAVGVADGSILICDPQTGRPASTLKGDLTLAPTELRFFVRGDATFLLAIHSAFVEIWDVAAGSSQRIEGVRIGEITAVGISADGRLLALGGPEAKEVVLVDLASGKIARKLGGT